MTQTVLQTAAEQQHLGHMVKVILRHGPDFAAKQWQQHGVPPPPCRGGSRTRGAGPSAYCPPVPRCY